MAKRKWFQAAIEARPPYTLGGWSKRLKASTRRAKALRSRPKNWSLDKRYLSAARALQALANVTRDPATKRAAEADAKYFFAKARKT